MTAPTERLAPSAAQEYLVNTDTNRPYRGTELRTTRIGPYSLSNVAGGGWQWKYESEIAADALPEGHYRFGVRLKIGGAIRTAAQVDFIVGVPVELVDGLIARSIGEAIDARDIAGLAQVQAQVSSIAFSYVDPQTGALYTAETLLRQVLGRTTWLGTDAAYEDRVREVWRVLRALHWRRLGAATSDAPIVLYKQAHEERPDDPFDCASTLSSRAITCTTRHRPRPCAGTLAGILSLHKAPACCW